MSDFDDCGSPCGTSPWSWACNSFLLLSSGLMQLFLSLEFGTLVFVLPLCYFGSLYWVFVLIAIRNDDDFASKSSVSKAKDAERIRRK
jgi:hypothetical protein